MSNIFTFYLILLLSGVFHFLIRGMYEDILWDEIWVHAVLTFVIGTTLYYFIYNIDIYLTFIL